MAQGKIGRVYEVSCKQCGKVEVLAKTLLGSQKHLRLLGWRETQAHDWYCSECKDSVTTKELNAQDYLSRLAEYSCEDNS